jgi:membrane protease YdiL (CAAX protease family)
LSYHLDAVSRVNGKTVMESASDNSNSIAGSTNRVSRAQFLRLGVWFTLALWLAATVIPLLLGRPGIWPALGLVDLLTWQTALGGLLGLIIGRVLVALILHWRPLHVIAERLDGLVAWETLRTPDYVTIASLAALGEEPLFRGVLQPSIGLLPTGVLFGLLHATSVAHVVLACILGLLLGWLYQWSGSLWSPIAAHLAIDLVTGLLMTRAPRPTVG